MPNREPSRGSLRALIVILLLLAANAALAEPRFPETEPGRLMGEWLRHFNAADATGLAGVYEKFTPEARRQRPARELAMNAMQGRETFGPLSLHEIESSAPGELAVHFASAGPFPDWIRYAYKFDPAARQVTKSEFRVVDPPKSAALTMVPVPELGADLEAKLSKLAEQDEFSGAILIARDGKPVWQKAFGWKDRERKLAADLETRFRVGSMNKMFTGVAIAQLVERGKLKFDSRLVEVLPDYPNKEVAGKVTVEQLLTHSAGLGDIFGPRFMEEKENLRTLQDYLPLFVDQPLKFAPGSDWSYSNGGYIVLGLIVERLSGQSYYDYVQKNILDVAGMSGTSFIPKTERPEFIAVGYTRMSGALAPNWDTLPFRGMSAGGGESTVGDLVRFGHALKSGKLLSAGATEHFVTGKVATGPGSPDKYSYGIADRPMAGRRVVGHAGGAPGMNGQFLMLWEEGYSVAVLANRDPGIAEKIARYIVGRLP